jgi:hypothetical protein
MPEILAQFNRDRFLMLPDMLLPGKTITFWQLDAVCRLPTPGGVILDPPPPGARVHDQHENHPRENPPLRHRG